MIIDVKFGYESDKIIIILFFKVLTLNILGLYSKDDVLLGEGIVDEELNTITFELVSDFDNSNYYIKENNIEILGLKLHQHLIIESPSLNEDLIQFIIEGQSYYEVNFQKPPNEIMPPLPKPMYRVKEVEEIKNMINEEGYIRGWNEGFSIGKSL